MDMHMCSHSTTTIAPRGLRWVTSASTIWVVRRSCTWGRRAKNIHETGQLAQARHLALMGRDVPHVRDAVERYQMVLARGVERDVLDQHEFLVVQVELGGQDVLGILVQAREDLGVSLGNTLRRIHQTTAIRVLAHGNEDLADGRLNAGAVDLMRVVSVAVAVATRGFLPGRIAEGTAGGTAEVVVVDVSHSRKLSRVAKRRCLRPVQCP
jgi:hypothetical protein